MSHTTGTILMVEPVNFYANPDTLQDNQFQNKSSGSGSALQLAAQAEFRALRATLEQAGIKVVCYADLAENKTPDSIFPNNWFSTHRGGKMVLYPMKAPSRRHERRADIIAELRKRYSTVHDLTSYEAQDVFLEGTGSLVLDRVKRIAYACLSQRTDLKLIESWAKLLNYSFIVFHAHDSDGQEIYHTNCMMSVGTSFAVLCLESIVDLAERQAVVASLEGSGKQLFEISYDQMRSFCANILELRTAGSAPLLVMSSAAHNAFSAQQLQALNKYGRIVHSSLANIERYGGGSARCMLAELF